ncbi:MAG: hypothetical protein RRZ84_05760 [Romboutsia sp.]
MRLQKVMLAATMFFMITITILINTDTLEHFKAKKDVNNDTNNIIETISTNEKINTDEAINKVKEYLYDTDSYIPSIVEVDNVSEGKYLVHTYEIIKNEGGEHTSTVGWFEVDIYTGKVTDIMK